MTTFVDKSNATVFEHAKSLVDQGMSSKEAAKTLYDEYGIDYSQVDPNKPLSSFAQTGVERALAAPPQPQQAEGVAASLPQQQPAQPPEEEPGFLGKVGSWMWQVPQVPAGIVGGALHAPVRPVSRGIVKDQFISESNAKLDPIREKAVNYLRWKGLTPPGVAEQLAESSRGWFKNNQGTPPQAAIDMGLASPEELNNRFEAKDDPLFGYVMKMSNGDFLESLSDQELNGLFTVHNTANQVRQDVDWSDSPYLDTFKQLDQDITESIEENRPFWDDFSKDFGALRESTIHLLAELMAATPDDQAYFNASNWHGGNLGRFYQAAATGEAFAAGIPASYHALLARDADMVRRKPVMSAVLMLPILQLVLRGGGAGAMGGALKAKVLAKMKSDPALAAIVSKLEQPVVVGGVALKQKVPAKKGMDVAHMPQERVLTKGALAADVAKSTVTGTLFGLPEAGFAYAATKLGGKAFVAKYPELANTIYQAVAQPLGDIAAPFRGEVRIENAASTMKADNIARGLGPWLERSLIPEISGIGEGGGYNIVAKYAETLRPISGEVAIGGSTVTTIVPNFSELIRVIELEHGTEAANTAARAITREITEAGGVEGLVNIIQGLAEKQKPGAKPRPQAPTEQRQLKVTPEPETPLRVTYEEAPEGVQKGMVEERIQAAEAIPDEALMKEQHIESTVQALEGDLKKLKKSDLTKKIEERGIFPTKSDLPKGYARFNKQQYIDILLKDAVRAQEHLWKTRPEPAPPAPQAPPAARWEIKTQDGSVKFLPGNLTKEQAVAQFNRKMRVTAESEYNPATEIVSIEKKGVPPSGRPPRNFKFHQDTDPTAIWAQRFPGQSGKGFPDPQPPRTQAQPKPSMENVELPIAEPVPELPPGARETFDRRPPKADRTWREIEQRQREVKSDAEKAQSRAADKPAAPFWQDRGKVLQEAERRLAAERELQERMPDPGHAKLADERSLSLPEDGVPAAVRDSIFDEAEYSDAVGRDAKELKGQLESALVDLNDGYEMAPGEYIQLLSGTEVGEAFLRRHGVAQLVKNEGGRTPAATEGGRKSLTPDLLEDVLFEQVSREAIENTPLGQAIDPAAPWKLDRGIPEPNYIESWNQVGNIQTFLKGLGLNEGQILEGLRNDGTIIADSALGRFLQGGEKFVTSKYPWERDAWRRTEDRKTWRDDQGAYHTYQPRGKAETQPTEGMFPRRKNDPETLAKIENRQAIIDDYIKEAQGKGIKVDLENLPQEIVDLLYDYDMWDAAFREKGIGKHPSTKKEFYEAYERRAFPEYFQIFGQRVPNKILNKMNPKDVVAWEEGFYRRREAAWKEYSKQRDIPDTEVTFNDARRALGEEPVRDFHPVDQLELDLVHPNRANPELAAQTEAYLSKSIATRERLARETAQWFKDKNERIERSLYQSWRTWLSVEGGPTQKTLQFMKNERRSALKREAKKLKGKTDHLKPIGMKMDRGLKQVHYSAVPWYERALFRKGYDPYHLEAAKIKSEIQKYYYDARRQGVALGPAREVSLLRDLLKSIEKEAVREGEWSKVKGEGQIKPSSALAESLTAMDINALKTVLNEDIYRAMTRDAVNPNSKSALAKRTIPILERVLEDVYKNGEGAVANVQRRLAALDNMGRRMSDEAVALRGFLDLSREKRGLRSTLVELFPPGHQFKRGWLSENAPSIGSSKGVAPMSHLALRRIKLHKDSMDPLSPAARQQKRQSKVIDEQAAAERATSEYWQKADIDLEVSVHGEQVSQNIVKGFSKLGVNPKGINLLSNADSRLGISRRLSQKIDQVVGDLNNFAGIPDAPLDAFTHTIASLFHEYPTETLLLSDFMKRRLAEKITQSIESTAKAEGLDFTTRNREIHLKHLTEWLGEEFRRPFIGETAGAPTVFRNVLSDFDLTWNEGKSSTTIPLREMFLKEVAGLSKKEAQAVKAQAVRGLIETMAMDARRHRHMKNVTEGWERAGISGYEDFIDTDLKKRDLSADSNAAMPALARTIGFALGSYEYIPQVLPGSAKIIRTAGSKLFDQRSMIETQILLHRRGIDPSIKQLSKADKDLLFGGEKGITPTSEVGRLLDRFTKYEELGKIDENRNVSPRLQESLDKAVDNLAELSEDARAALKNKDGESRLAADPGWNDYLGWEIKANEQLKGMEAILRKANWQMKANLTVLNPMTHIGNTLGNVGAICIMTGETPFSVVSRTTKTALSFMEFKRLGRKEFAKKMKKKGANPILAEAFEALENTNLDQVTLVKQEMGHLLDMVNEPTWTNGAKSFVDKRYGAFEAPARVLEQSARKVKQGVDWLSRKAAEAYNFEDVAFKVSEFVREYAEAKQIINDAPFDAPFGLRTGHDGYTYVVKRKVDGKTTYSFPKKKGQKLDSINDRVGAAAATKVHDIVFDYARVPNFVRAIRNNSLFTVFSPFVTWTWKALDLPGKKGLMSATLREQPVIISANPEIMAAAFKKRHNRNMRKALMLAGATSLLSEDHDHYKQVARYGREPLGYVSALTQMGTDPGSVKTFRLTNSDIYEPSMIAARNLLSIASMYKEARDQMFGVQPEDAIGGLAHKAFKQGMVLDAKNILRLGQLSGGPLAEYVMMESLGRNEWGGAISNSDRWRKLGPALLGSIWHRSSDAMIGIVNPESEYTSRKFEINKSKNMTTYERDRILEDNIGWIFRSIVGLGWRDASFLKRSKQNISQIKKNMTDSMVTPLKEEIKRKKINGDIEGAIELARTAEIAARAIARESDKLYLQRAKVVKRLVKRQSGSPRAEWPKGFQSPKQAKLEFGK